MRITGLGETIAINYQTFDNFLFLYRTFGPLLDSSSSPVFPDSHFQREKFEGLNE